MTNHTCPSTNTAALEQSSFLDGRWDAHEIGWVIAGVTAAVTVVLTAINTWLHASNYYKPQEQRQIPRIIYMPAVYAVVSFFSYRFFRSYTYYEISVTVYEALAVMAFLMLLLTYVGSSTEEQREALKEKEKKKIPIPFCCIRYRPTKPYFLHALKWSVLQYSLVRPLLSIAGIICEAYNVLCPEKYAWYFAEVYIEAIDFISISIALYGLIVFYGLVKDRLKGRRPLAKFLCIKLIIALIWYQGFIFSALTKHGVIKATDYWTTTNIADGLTALCVCCEMVLFSAFMIWAYNYKEYRLMRPGGASRTSIWRPLWDSINFWDFVVEGWKGIRFLFDYVRNKPGTHASDEKKVSTGLDFDQAFAPSRPSLSEIPMMPRGTDTSNPTIPYNRPSGNFDTQPPAFQTISDNLAYDHRSSSTWQQSPSQSESFPYQPQPWQSQQHTSGAPYRMQQ